MEQVKALNVAIVGGGRACKAVMAMILSEKLRRLRMNIVGVADRNVEAAGYRYALEKLRRLLEPHFADTGFTK